MTVAILDADVIAYVAAAEALNHQPIHWGEDVTSNDVGLAKAIEVAESMVTQWKKGANADAVVLAFSGESYLNFRRDIHPHYKAKRSSEKPEHYVEVVMHLRQTNIWEAQDTLEGDDLLGVMAEGEEFVAVSTDKDILTLPGHVVHVKNHKFTHHQADEVRANYYWMTQTLTGDTVDGYKGAPGIGAKGAEKALDGIRTLERMWRAVVETYGDQLRKPKYRDKFVHRSAYREALMNAQCARILRVGDYDFNTEEVKLWVPQ